MAPRPPHYADIRSRNQSEPSTGSAWGSTPISLHSAPRGTIQQHRSIRLCVAPAGRGAPHGIVQVATGAARQARTKAARHGLKVGASRSRVRALRFPCPMALDLRLTGARRSSRVPSSPGKARLGDPPLFVAVTGQLLAKRCGLDHAMGGLWGASPKVSQPVQVSYTGPARLWA